jgi:hypothetical protein
MKSHLVDMNLSGIAVIQLNVDILAAVAPTPPLTLVRHHRAGMEELILGAPVGRYARPHPQVRHAAHLHLTHRVLQPGLAIKTHPTKPPKKNQKNHLKKPTKNVFFFKVCFGFFKFFIFYENNTNFSL